MCFSHACSASFKFNFIYLKNLIYIPPPVVHGDMYFITQHFFRKEIQEINWERKHAQIKAGEKLKKLEAMWDDLVRKNYEIEQACVELEENLTPDQRKQLELLNS